jgi:hypothetical protein
MKIDYATLQSFERTKEPEREQSNIHLFTLMLMAIFFVVLMAALAAGVMLYSTVLDTGSKVDDRHMQSGFIANVVHMTDAASSIARGQGPEGDSLVLVENLETGTFETRVYLHDGKVVQEYAIAGRPYDPTGAIELFASERFEFAFADGLLHLETDQGPLDVALRSAQDGGKGGAA